MNLSYGLEANFNVYFLMKRKLLIILALLVLSGVGFFAYIFFNLNAVIASFKPQIEKLASEVVGTPVRIKTIEASVFPDAKLILTGFDLGNESSKKESLSLKEVALAVKLMPLLSGKVEITKLVLNSPQIIIYKDNEGVHIPGVKKTSNSEAEKAKSEDKEKNPKTNSNLSLNLEALEVKDGFIKIQDSSKPEPLSISNISLDSKLSLLGDKLSISSYSVNAKALEKIPLNVKGANFNFDLASGKLEAPHVDINVGGEAFISSVQYDTKGKSGTVSISSSGNALSTFLSANSSFSTFIPPTAQELNISGSVIPNLKVKLEENGFYSSGKIDFSKVFLSSAGYQLSDFAGSVNVNASKDFHSLSSQKIQLSVNGSPIAIEFSLDHSENKLVIKDLQIHGFSGLIKSIGNVDLGNAISFSTQNLLSTISIVQLLKSIAPTTPPKIEGTLTKANAQIAGTIGKDLMQNLTGQVSFVADNCVLKGVNIGAKVLKASNEIPLLAGTLYSLVPASHRQLLDSEDTKIINATGDFTIRSGSIYSKNIKVLNEIYYLEADGRIGLDSSMDLNATISFTPEFSQSLTLKIKEVGKILDANKRLTIPLTLSGKFPALIIIPNFKKLIEIGTRKVIQDKAAEVLEKALDRKGGQLLRGLGF